jgi:peptidoglycan-N-acetylglucosamine deacetylase
MFSRNFPFSRENALENYTLERLEHGMIEANEASETFAGRRPTSFAYPCGQRFVGRGKATRSHVPLVAEHFLVDCGFLDEGPNDPLRCDMAQVNGAAGDGRDIEHLGEAIDSALEEGRWLVLVAHDVASETTPQAMRTSVLEEECQHASSLPELWTDTVLAVGSLLI